MKIFKTFVVFVIVSFLVILISWTYYGTSFGINVLIEAHGMLFDIFVKGREELTKIIRKIRIDQFFSSEIQRYFFSAVFQGFAALIALGSMLYLYYMQLLENRKGKIKNKMYKQYDTTVSTIKNYTNRIGIVPYVKNDINGHPGRKTEHLETIRSLLKDYDSLENKSLEIKKKVPSILIPTVIILLLSLISLFLTREINNSFIIVIGVIILLFSCYTLIRLLIFILNILKSE